MRPTGTAANCRVSNANIGCPSHHWHAVTSAHEGNKESCASAPGRRKAATESFGPARESFAFRQAAVNNAWMDSANIPWPRMRVCQRGSFSFPSLIARMRLSTLFLRSG
jgi:hypothetical protein